MTVPVALAGVSGILSVSGISGNVAGCQSLSLWERCLRSRRRGQGCCQRARHTAIRTLLVRAIVSLCFRVLFCRTCPLRRWRASSPKGRALGKEVSFSMKPICVCWKTSRNAKASHFGRGVCGADGEGKDADKKQKNTAIQALFVRDIVSLCFRVLFCRACPLRRWRASSPKGRALGKEVSFSMKLICVCWKTSRNAKASPTRGGGIERSEDDGEVVQSSTCVIPLPRKASERF